jgi:hypothetical protein
VEMDLLLEGVGVGIGVIGGGGCGAADCCGDGEVCVAGGETRGRVFVVVIVVVPIAVIWVSWLVVCAMMYRAHTRRAQS